MPLKSIKKFVIDAQLILILTCPVSYNFPTREIIQKGYVVKLKS